MRAPWSMATLACALTAGVVLTIGAGAASASSVQIYGSGGPHTGDFSTNYTGAGAAPEFAGADEEDGPDAYAGTISLSSGAGGGAGVNSAQKAKSNPTVDTSFQGLNHYQQRYSRGGNQFSIEPPDQGLCVGGGYELEAVNDVLNVFNAAGASALPDNTATNIVSGFPRNVNHAVDLNSFYGYIPAVNRTTGIRGPEVTDPSCMYDAQTQRWFVVVLTLEVNPTSGAFTHQNHLDLAVSKTANPTGAWTIYRFDVTNDGTNAGGANPGPYLGDYPHIGADANGIYLTTNAYPWNSNGFAGAQIYAMSKSQLAAGAANVDVVHIDTFGQVNVPSEAGPTQPGFTVWPAHSPGTSSYDANAGGTEYFLSSNAADEATHPVTGTGGNYVSNQIVTWALTNTSSLNTATPDLHLGTKVLTANTYAIPPKQKQQGAGTAPGVNVPQGHCINDTTTSTIAGVGCWRLLFGGEPAHNEVISTPDSNDTRMQQVMYSNGKIWGALDTALNPGGTAQRAGIAWYIVKPDVSSGSLAAKMALQGYLGAAGSDMTYPTIGVTASGRGIMGFTYSGDSAYPSAAYAPIDAQVGVGPWAVVPGGAGQAADDGFTSYKSQVGNPPRTRWGDYGAAAVDGNHVWLASEYVAHSCDYATWGGPFFAGGSGDNLLGTCAGASHGPGTRTALGNWSTRISELTP